MGFSVLWYYGITVQSTPNVPLMVCFEPRSDLTPSSFFFLFTWTRVRCYLRHTFSTRVRLSQPWLEIFCRRSKAMKSNLAWRDLLRSYDCLIVRIFSFKRLYLSLLMIYNSENQANPRLYQRSCQISHTFTPRQPRSTRVLKRVTR